MARQNRGSLPALSHDLAEFGQLGGGSSAPAPFPVPLVGEWVAISTTSISGNIGVPTNTQVFGELWLPAGTYDQAEFYVGGAATAGGVTRVGIYADDGLAGGGKPGTLLYGSAGIDATTTGMKTITGLGLVIASYQRVWTALVSQVAGAGYVGVNAASNQQVGPSGGLSNFSYGSAANAWAQSGVSGALVASAAPTSRNDYAFRVGLHRSA